MCGIAGKIHFDSTTPVDRGLLERMLAVIAYRGPDGAGIHLSGPVGLAHRRLSIIDVGSSGAQPMCNEDATVWITFNGEIYNYRQLREQLLRLGHSFSSHSDTEVIVHLYEQYGSGCLAHLRGMFAFAIWDEKEQTLFVARDRVGIKPLYYFRTGASLTFASEIKALLEDTKTSPRANYGAVDAFLTHLYSPSEETIFCGVRKLLPGHFLVVKDGKVRLEQYWELDFASSPSWGSVDEAAEALGGLLRDTVREHMISDVPVGFLASGGIDSTALLSFAVDQTDKPIQTFTVGFDGGQVADERPYAALVARRFGTLHHDITVTAAEFQSLLPLYVWHMEEPVCEPPGIALYCVSRLAAQHVSVLLSGEGGDEAFAGYPEYRNFLLLEKLKSRAGALSHLLAPLVSMLGAISRLSKIKRYGGMLRSPLSHYYYSRTSTPFNGFNAIKSELYSSDFKQVLRERINGQADALSEHPSTRHFESVRQQSPLNQMLFVDTKTWLPDDLLIKADRMTMANSLELRVPFLDHRVLEFAAGLPDDFKVDGFDTKVALRKTFAMKIPPEVLNRKKAGFPVPYKRWIGKEMRSYVADTVLSSRAMSRGYFSRPALEKLIFGNDGGADRSSEKFSLLVLELWHRRFLDMTV